MKGAEDPGTALGIEFALMAKDPAVVALRQYLFNLYRTTRSLDPRTIYETTKNLALLGIPLFELVQCVSPDTGSHFFTMKLADGRTLHFFISKLELAAFDVMSINTGDDNEN